MQPEIIDERDDVILFPGVLSPAECRAHVERAEAVGFAPAPITTRRGPLMAPEIRNNTRVMIDDTEATAALFARMRPLLPAVFFGWHLRGLNERLRWYRYDVGERFNWHYDGSFARSRAERSRLTLMLYLNDGFDGGETMFDLSGGMRVVRPRAGAALIFPHALRHTGAVVTRGRKYVLRTDVMYAL